MKLETKQTMNKKIIIKNYEQTCNDISEKINNVYFGGETDMYWIGSEIGSVLSIADYFLDMNMMVTALKEKATKKQFFGWYDKWLESGGKPDINFKNFIRLNKIR